MIKEWILKELPTTEVVSSLKEALNINEVLCSLLIQRGITSLEDAKAFFRPELKNLHDPFDMKGMDLATDRLTRAIGDQEKILIYGDYDVDGTTSVAMMYNFLKELSPNVFTYIPDRYTEGYGVSEKGIRWAIEHDIKLLITLDCGIQAADNINLAKENNIDTIICDHHLPGESLPPALAVLDAKQKDCSYPYDELSGCGVGFKLLQAFCIQNGIEDKKLFQQLDLVAISIASDIVPITGENRTLAWFGIKKLNKAPLAGLDALIEKSGLHKSLSISNVVFGIGPRINAAGRIGHAKTALDLLTQTDKSEALVFAEKLNLENTERRNYDENITADALAMIVEDNQVDNASTILYKHDWHKGVIGIVASRCIEHYYKPTIIMTESNGKITGSARSVNGFDIHEAISKCSAHLEQFGGHKYAAGLTLEKSSLDNFKAAFEKAVSEQILEEQKTPIVEIDLEITFDQIDFDMYNILKQMGPLVLKTCNQYFVQKI